ncbi:MAG: N-acetylmuramic acid 6-phosphate etherase [Bacteroidetes bacterium]|nr:N-acetylmuramic acid 6-phosphate etherase [Bacteroidota bacterium]
MRITEQPSEHRHLEQLPVRELLERMNAEDQTVPAAVARALPRIEALIEAVVDHLLAGGRLFYLGAGTSGRLGVVDASECPPTFGVPQGLVVGLIAGGDAAIRKAVEFAEDDLDAGWRDLQEHGVSAADLVVGIAASGGTPYVVGALKHCRAAGIKTGCIVCNPDSAVAAAADFPVEVVVGPEFVTGSTRLKAGTAQKLVLNMVSTAAMIRLGRVKDNRMVDMQLSNEKLVERGTRMVMEGTGLPAPAAKDLLLTWGSVREAIRQFEQEQS